MLRPVILLFFLIGLGLRVHRFDLARIDRWMPVALPAYFGMAIVWIWASFIGRDDLPSPVVVCLDLGLRFAATMPFWWFAGILVSRWRSVMVRLERYVFTLFCSHVIVFKVLSVPGKRVFGDFHSDTYWVLFLPQPPIAILVSVILVESMRAMKRRSGAEAPEWIPYRAGSLGNNRTDPLPEGVSGV